LLFTKIKSKSENLFDLVEFEAQEIDTKPQKFYMKIIAMNMKEKRNMNFNKKFMPSGEN
jgi:hypothetical protein